MQNKMARVAASAQWICSFVLALCCLHGAQGEEIRDYYSEPGLNPFKDALNQNLNEHIDPFSGTLQLKYTDVTVPGNGGMDININRVYVSLQDTSLPLLGITGVGWVMHFGRIVTPQRNADKICGQALFSVTTADNPSLELPDGGRELLVLNSINNDGSLITRSNWKAHCVAGQSGMLVTSPEGTKYTMSYATFLQGEPSWMTTRVEDVHGNWIRIDYQTNAAGISYISEIYRSEEGGENPVVTYEYEDQDSAGIKLSAISANGQRWQYFYEPIPGYLYDHYQQLVAVQRPDGRRWQYAYNPAPQDPDPDDEVIEISPGGYSLRQMVYPHGASVDYTYQYVQFDPGSGLRTTAVQTKSVGGTAVSNGQWQFAFAPHSRPYTTSDGYTLRYDVTTITAPDAIYRYVHYGKDFAGLPNGNQVSIKPSFVGLLAFKETYSLGNVLMEDRAYVWGSRMISTENFWHGAGYRDWWIENETYAPVPMGEGYDRDAATGNTTYQHVKLYFNYDAYGNPGGVYEKSNIANHLSRQTLITYRNDVSRWIIGLPLTETIQAVQAAQDQGTTVGQITRTYFDHGKLRTENRFGVVTEYTYTSAGDVASIEDARGFTREYSNYRRGIPRREDLPESVVILRDVNSTGTLQSQTNGRGFTTSFTYDDLNRLTGIDYPINADVTISYDAQGGASRRVLARSQYRQTELINDFGQTIRTERRDQQSGETISKTMSFDALGRQTFVTYPNKAAGLTTTYDSLGRIRRTQHPDMLAVTYTYDDQTVVVLNERNSRSEYVHLIYGVDDSPQEPYLQVQNLNVATIIERDVLSNTTRVLQGTLSGGSISGYSKTYQYDSRKFLTRAIEPEVGTTVYTHDDVGNVLTESINSAPPTTFAWDDLGRRVGVDFADATPDVVTVYDRNSNVIELHKGQTRWNYVYDENNNLRSETLSVQDPWFGPRSYLVTYAHDLMDVVSSMTYPSGLAVQFAPDAFGRATRVGTFASNVLYHPSGQLSSYTLGNGVTTTVALNQRLLTERIQAGGLLDLTYGYDNAGNVASINDSIVPTESVSNLGYDGLERLTAATGRWGQRSFTYDSNGNFNTRVTGSAIRRHTLDGRSRLAQIASGDTNFPSEVYDTTQFEYDLRGNITSKRFYQLYAWQAQQGYIRSVDTRLRFDAASNLSSAEVRDSNQQNNPTRRSYAYDGNGMRYSEREAKGHSLRHSVYGSSSVLLFEDSFGECARTDHIVLGALNIAKSRDEFASATTDSDGDGLPNCIEVQLGLNPQNAGDAAGDLDNDGLSNRAEFDAGSSPLFADTDGDGLSDAAEVRQHGSDPFSTDGDGDGVSDADEAADPRLNPRLADSDHDGVTDYWEMQLRSDPSDPLDASQDFDSDGFSNRQESWTNLDPLRLERAPTRGAPGIRIDIGGAVTSQPAIGRDGALYLPNTPSNISANYVVAMNADGSVRWNMLEPGTIVGPMTVGADGAVYYWTRPPASQATQPRSILYARNPDGSVRWTVASVVDYFQSGVALGRDGQVLVGGYRQNTSQGVMTTVDRNGVALSSKLVTSQVLRAPIVAPDGTTFVAGGTGIVYAYNPDGSTKWTYTLRAAPSAELSLGPNGMLYVADSLGYTSALQANGALLWERRHSTTTARSSVVVGENGTLYQGTAAGQLLALSASSGLASWAAAVSGTAVLTPVLARDGTIYAVTTGGTVAAFGPAGNVVWSAVSGSVVSTAPTLDRDGTLYVGTMRGQVLSYVDRAGGLARTPWPMQRHDSAATSSLCFNSESFSYITDTDGDHLQDCDEFWFGLNPNDPADGALDLDGDGLSNTEEAQLGTRTDRADTDGDGLTDSQEVRIYRSNPLSTDSDGDSLLDGYEVQYQFNPSDPADALLDADNDGYSNRQEMLAGTDPLNLSQAPVTGAILKTVTDSTFPVRQPAAHPGGVIYMNGPSRLEARNLDLSLRWSWPETVEGNVAVGSNSLVYAITRVGTGTPRLVALHPDGKLRWSFPITSSWALSAFDGPVLGNDGSVYFTYSYRNDWNYAVVVALDSNGRQTGTAQYFNVGGDVPKRLSVDAQGNVLFAYSNLFSMQPGTLLSRWTSGMPSNTGGMSVPVVDSNGVAYVTRSDGLHAISLATGAVQWSNTSAKGQPVLTEDGLIVATCTSNSQLCAFDRGGLLAWQMTTAHTLLGAPAVDANNVIHQMTGNGLYLRVSAAGVPVAQATVPSMSAFQYPLILPDGMIYLGMAGTNLLLSNDANGAVASPWPTRNRDATSRRNASSPAIGPVPSQPAVSLTAAPPTFMHFRDSRPVTVHASDYADGLLNNAVQWSSDVDGVLGQGARIDLQVLSSGTHVITASVEDSAGLTGAVSFQVQVDYAPPTLTVTTPLGAVGYEAALPVRFTGTSVDAVDGDISDQITWTSSQDGLIGTGRDFTAMLSLGEHRLTISSLNSVGLTATRQFYIYLVHQPPVINISSPAGGNIEVPVGAPVTFTATATDGVDGDLSAQLRWWSVIDGHLHVGSTFTAPALSVGSHYVVVESVDSHGSSREDAVGVRVVDPNNNAPGLGVSTSNYEPNHGQPVTFTAYFAQDTEDGAGLTNIRWFSHRDGALGTGTSITTGSLSVGKHRISGVLTDSGGAKDGEYVVITVRALSARATGNREGLLARGFNWLTRSPNHLWHLMLRWPAESAEAGSRS